MGISQGFQRLAHDSDHFAHREELAVEGLQMALQRPALDKLHNHVVAFALVVILEIVDLYDVRVT
jgi:hypothetical protein